MMSLGRGTACNIMHGYEGQGTLLAWPCCVWVWVCVPRAQDPCGFTPWPHRVLFSTGSDLRVCPCRPSNVGYVIIIAPAFEKPLLFCGVAFHVHLGVHVQWRWEVLCGGLTMAFGPRILRPSDRSISPSSRRPFMMQTTCEAQRRNRASEHAGDRQVAGSRTQQAAALLASHESSTSYPQPPRGGPKGV